MWITTFRKGRNARRGGALLAVLWLSAALSAVAFSLAHTVRGETERTATSVEGLRSYYLAVGAVERAIAYMQWGPYSMLPDGTSRYYTPGQPLVALRFPTGEALVEIIPESAKLNINSARIEDLAALLAALGVEAGRAGEIAAAIADWRSPVPAGGASGFDLFYSSLNPSFQARHASFEEIEELMLVKGMTADIFHGSWARDERGRLVARGGLRDCVSVYGGYAGFDINTAHPAVLALSGVGSEVAAGIVARRRVAPFRRNEEAAPFLSAGRPGALRLGGGPIFTVRATARVRGADGRLSDLRRSAAAMVTFTTPKTDGALYRVLRWYDYTTTTLEWSH
jgi:general secretion pathway protein K